jgi:hypothetical protein
VKLQHAADCGCPTCAPCEVAFLRSTPAEVRVIPLPTVERRGTVVHINGEPTLQLNAPIATRPQDWAEPARSLLFGRVRA